MLRHYGPMGWRNVHLTQETYLADLIDVDNAALADPQPKGISLFKQAAHEIESVVCQARAHKKAMRSLGSGWAHTDIPITDGFLLNTKLLNACYDVSEALFHARYPAALRPLLVIAQCGISMGELNAHLEVTAPKGLRRSMKTAGIGAGQTVVGAVSGNTHGAAINFGSTPDFIVGMHLVTGAGKSWWIERASYPVMHDAFADALGAELWRDDEAFDAALVSFGACGVIAAVAIETDPIYDLEFGGVEGMTRSYLKDLLARPEWWKREGLHHFEFIFDPYADDVFVARGMRHPYDPAAHRLPAQPTWIVRDVEGFAPGVRLGGVPFSLPLPSDMVTRVQLAEYRKRAILNCTRGTPGQLFTATITYLEGYIESAIAVSLDDAAAALDICASVLKEQSIESIGQVRFVHPSRGLLAFTRFAPKTLVFEFAMSNDASFARFENALASALDCSRIPYAFHWSKNSGIDPERLHKMYGASNTARWKRARLALFRGDREAMRVFDNAHVRRAGLDQD